MVRKYWMLVIVIAFLCVVTACSFFKEESVPNPQSNKEEEVPTMNEMEAKEAIVLSFAGDTMAAGKVASFLEKNGYRYPWEQAKPFLEQSDIAMVNLETPVSLRGDAKNKQYAYQTHPDFLKGMKWAGVDIVTLANNHSLDYGVEAFQDTLDHLKEQDIAYVGGGINEEEAYSAKQMTVKGKTISFLGFSRVLPSVSWYAGQHQPGLASGYQVDKVYEVVTEVVKESDITVVYMHWGEELADHPEQEEREMAHHMIDLGADIVVGAHSHVLQGLEYYKGKLIAYSLGNFIFTTSYQETARQSAILQVAINEDGSQSVSVHPMKIDRGAVWVAEEQEKSAVLNRLKTLSKDGEWTEDGEYIPE